MSPNNRMFKGWGPQTVSLVRWTAVARWLTASGAPAAHVFSVTEQMADIRRRLRGHPRRPIHRHITETAYVASDDWREAGSPGWNAAYRIAARQLTRNPNFKKQDRR